MVSRLGTWLLLAVLVMPAAAATKPGSITGYVKDASGVPQMGAAVEVLASAARDTRIVFTDARGLYHAAELAPGVYQVKVTSPSFLPSLRENVALRAGAHAIVNLTLHTLFEAIQWLPARRTSRQEEEEWKWTLRSVVNRPILRVLDNNPVVVTSENGERRLKARVAFLAGAEGDGFGGSADMSTSFSVQQSLFSSGTLSLGGNVGYGSGNPAAVVRASYSHALRTGSRPQVALTARHFASPEAALPGAALDALAVSLSDGITVADFVELNYGGEMQSVQFGKRITAFRPFGSVVVHMGPNTVVEYRYATSQPTTRAAKGFDSAPADLSESGPRMSLQGAAPALERARHHELSVSRRLGDNNFQLAFYSDRISNAALVGVGDVTADSGEFLPDVYSGTFSYSAGDFSTTGMRLVYQRKLAADLTATAEYGYGGAVDLADANLQWQEVRASWHSVRRHAVTTKFAGRIPRSNTRWIASYKWTSGRAVSPLDMFNASPGQADPYLNIFIRQPIPATSFFPGRLEALVDLRNLLAQGYVPVLGQDGETLFLVQSARAIRGGVAFSF
ncbi:MAG TPA: carboxypeptidase-like regulatory domain-containing protein [Terriglobales bacterium]|nr:carboxypeptidase-like regulatory domain-containing protein [Terriglobales bacterium]